MNKSKLPALTGLRGIAAYLVVIAHAADISFDYGSGSIAQPYTSRIAYLGMSIFFILSGFVIHYNYSTLIGGGERFRRSYNFIVARLARIYPLYIIVLIFFCGKSAFPSFSENRFALFSYLTLTQSWANLQGLFFPPSWSVSTEWFFYLVFVLSGGGSIITAIKRPNKALVVFLVITPIVLAILLSFKLHIAPTLLMRLNNSSYDPWFWLIYFCPPIRLLEFVAGMLAAQTFLIVTKPKKERWHDALLIACIAWCIAIILIGNITDGKIMSNILPNFIYAPALAVIVLSVCRYDSLTTRFLSSKPLIVMGEISYSVYLLSFVIMTAIPNNFPFFNHELRFIAIIGMTTIIAYGSQKLIEVPARKMMRRFLTRPSQQSL